MQTFLVLRTVQDYLLRFISVRSLNLINMNYARIYNQIITKSKLLNRKKVKGGQYFEEHHIIPTCVGGENKKNNKVLLTGREHFICHKLLVEILPHESKLVYALHRMMFSRSDGRDYRVSSREYERLRREFSSVVSNNMTGRIASEETRAKARISHSGFVMPQEQKDKIGVANTGDKNGNWGKKGVDSPNTGKKRTKECCDNISERMKGENNPSVKYGPWNKDIHWSPEVKLNIGKGIKDSGKAAGSNNPKYKEIPEEIWNKIFDELGSGTDIYYTSVICGISVDRIYRNLYFIGAIEKQDLPNYIRNYISDRKTA
jgi:hypothetical protein